MWNTLWPAPRFVLKTVRYPVSEKPRSLAIAAARRTSSPSICSSSTPTSFNVGMWRFGTISTCVGACGSMSLNASTRSSSYTMLDGILRSMILQNRQSAMGDNSSAMKMTIAVALLAAGAVSTARAADVRAPVETHTNLTYYTGEGADKYRHRLDLYVPKGKHDVPVMMFVHGGGFTVGIKDQYAFVGQVFATYGIETAVINYRLAP